MRQINWAYEIKAMSMLKQELEDRIEEQHKNIIIWWCLCDYFAKHYDPNTLLNHEKTKLIPLMEDVRDFSVKKMNTEKIKRNALTYILKEKYNYCSHPNSLIRVIQGKFNEEHIDKMYWDEVVRDFINGVDKLIDVLSSKQLNLDFYIQNTF